MKSLLASLVVAVLAVRIFLAIADLPVAAGTADAAAVVPARIAPDGDADAETVRDALAVEGKQVPLPAGEWRLAGRGVSLLDPAHAAHVGPMVSLALVRLRDGVVDAAILIQTNQAGTPAPWGQPAACERRDLYHARIFYASDHDGFCAYVADVAAAGTDAGVDPAWHATLRHAALAGWMLPARWVVAAYRIADPRDALEVRYFFDPRHDAADAAAPDRPLPQRDVASLVAWSEANGAAIGAGFRNRLTAGAGPALPDWTAAAAPAALARAAHPPTSEGAGGMAGIGLKTLSYQAFGTLIGFGAWYLYLGSVVPAGGLALLGAAATGGLYAVHEWAWSYANPPAAAVGELPGIGIEGPAPANG